MPYSVPDQAFRVRDGYLAVSARTQAEWERLCRALGQEGLLDDPRYRTLAGRLAHRRELIASLAGSLPHAPCGLVDQSVDTGRRAVRTFSCLR